MKPHQYLNQRIIFNEIVKQERELRIQLFEYKQKIDNKRGKSKERKIMILNYETLLFNYYEYLAICLYKELISKNEAELYFKDRLVYVKEIFDSSILFKEGYAQKEQYKGIQWLFKKWGA